MAQCHGSLWLANIYFLLDDSRPMDFQIKTARCSLVTLPARGITPSLLTAGQEEVVDGYVTVVFGCHGQLYAKTRVCESIYSATEAMYNLTAVKVAQKVSRELVDAGIDTDKLASEGRVCLYYGENTTRWLY